MPNVVVQQPTRWVGPKVEGMDHWQQVGLLKWLPVGTRNGWRWLSVLVNERLNRRQLHDQGTAEMYRRRKNVAVNTDR